MFVVFVGALFTGAFLLQDDTLSAQLTQVSIHLGLYVPIVLLSAFFTLYDGILRRAEASH